MCTSSNRTPLHVGLLRVSQSSLPQSLHLSPDLASTPPVSPPGVRTLIYAQEKQRSRLWRLMNTENTERPSLILRLRCLSGYFSPSNASPNSCFLRQPGRPCSTLRQLWYAAFHRILDIHPPRSACQLVRATMTSVSLAQIPSIRQSMLPIASTRPRSISSVHGSAFSCTIRHS